MIWALVLMADYILEFRFEYLWPFWLLVRSVYDSFKYQGLVSLTNSIKHEKFIIFSIVVNTELKAKCHNTIQILDFFYTHYHDYNGHLNEHGEDTSVIDDYTRTCRLLLSKVHVARCTLS